MNELKPKLQQAFDAMMNGNQILLSEKERANHKIPEEIVDFMIEHIDQNHCIALYSEGLDEVIYDIGCDDILINENKLVVTD